MSMVTLHYIDAPCILYNLNGYYDSLKALLNHMVAMGLSTNERLAGIYFADCLEDIVGELNRKAKDLAQPGSEG